jgi:Flp pilus assembly protein TadD
MSIIQDALKKAQDERTKKKKQEVPYHLSGVQKKPKTLIIYVIVGLCVGAVFAWLYIPYFHKPKQIIQPVVAQPPVPVKPAQVAIVTPPAPEVQKPVKESAEKKVASTIVPVPQKPIVSVAPNNKQTPDVAKVNIVQTQKTGIAPHVERRSKVAESTGKSDKMSQPVRKADKLADSENTVNEPVRVVEKKTDDGGIDSIYNEALREQQSGRTREAKTIYKQILAKQPNHIESLNNLGVISIYEGNTQEALFYFKRILEYRKNYSKAYNNIGLIAMRDGDRQLAEEYLRKAISLEPDDPGPYVNLSALLRSQGKLQEAAKLLEIPIQKKAKDPDLLLSYAVIKDNLGQYEDAARYYRQYLSLLRSPASRKDILDRLQYIEDKR